MMPRKKLPLISIATYGLLTLMFSANLDAQPGNAKLEPIPGPPPIPSMESGQTLDPDITIIRGERKIVHEYRINGRLYAIKVIPRHGPAYYMIDIDGDGILDVREKFVLPVPQWVLLSW
uniref:DUF2782 domain-containing protein n=1 Tax=Candidatus Kentrum sp. FW TaxID=2126338 RepID=A0A450SQ20_9GAMM|nr:MAG: Protein of unknown function (DUF2782) [Candidatus Kentron sp. FW]